MSETATSKDEYGFKTLKKSFVDLQKQLAEHAIIEVPAPFRFQTQM